MSHFLFLVFTLFLAIPVEAKQLMRTQADYRVLSDFDKNQIIIKTMELVAEKEAAYVHEVRKFGYSQKRFEIYTKSLQKIKSILFFDEAHAAALNPASEWKRYAQQFSQAKKGSNLCLFGGWLSTAYKAGTKTVCKHPGRKSGCNEPNKVACNPAFFGFKQASSGSLFCVDSTNGAHNSSYLCMKEALAETKNSSRDSAQERLRFLRELLGKEENKALFADVQEFIYKTCVCEMADSNLNSEYHAYMRPHRTCMSMLNVLGQVACEPTTPILKDSSIFQSLNTFIQESDLESKSEVEIDSLYSVFVKDKLPGNRAEVARLCGGNGGGLDVTPEGGGTNTPTPGGQGGGGDQPAAQNPDNSGDIIVTGQPFHCRSVKCTPSEDPAQPPKCEYEIVRRTKDTVAPATPATTPGAAPEPVATTAAEPEKTETDDNEDQDATYTPIPNACTPEAGKPSNGSSDKPFTELKAEDVKIISSKPKEGDPAVRISFKYGESEIKLWCPCLTFPKEETTAAADDGTEPTIDTKREPSGDNAFKIKAIVDLKNLNGWKFAWELKIPENAKGISPEKDWEGKKEKPKKDENSGISTGDDSTQTPAKETAEEAPVDKLEIVQKRLSKSYEVCATLKKGDKEKSSCKSIDALGMKAPVVNPGMMPPNMRMFDTGMSGLGIK